MAKVTVPTISGRRDAHGFALTLLALLLPGQSKIRRRVRFSSSLSGSVIA